MSDDKMKLSKKIFDGYVLFIDVVKYSKEPPIQQRNIILELIDLIDNLKKKFESYFQISIIHTGDGAAIIFQDKDGSYFKYAITPDEAARELLQTINETKSFQIRIGINCGKLFGYTDTNGNTNIAGDTINIAARLMDAANPNQILFSETYFKELKDHYETHNENMPECDSYNIAIKHGLVIKAYVLQLENNEKEIPQSAIKYKLGDFYAHYFQFTPANGLGPKSITYYDNHKENSVALVLLHGLGLDSGDFYEFMRESNYRCIAPNLYGCEPLSTLNTPFALADHVEVIDTFINDCVYELRKDGVQQIILVGFSLGADIYFNTRSISAKNIHFLLLDPNINENTCFISKQIVRFSDKNSVYKQINLIMEQHNNADEWLRAARYFIKIFDKFQNRLVYIQQLAMEVVMMCRNHGYFEKSLIRFFDKYGEKNYIRFVFSDDDVHREHESIISMYLKNPIFNSVIVTSDSHFKLIDKTYLRNIVDKFIQDIDEDKYKQTQLCKHKGDEK